MVADRIVKVPYTYVRQGIRFYEPRGRMVDEGFQARPLGPDGPESRAKGWALYEDWLRVKRGEPLRSYPDAPAKDRQASASKVYPPGSIGECWQKWTAKGSTEWERLALSNRQKVWWPAWLKRIEPVFGHDDPNTITMEHISKWRAAIEKGDGLDVAHKALKTWRAFWKVLQGYRYTTLPDPSAKVVNKSPEARDQRYSQVEALTRAKAAWRAGYRGLACIIIICWDTGFSPKDARTLRQRHIGTDPKTGRLLFDRSREGRAKTGVAVIGTVSRLGDAMVRTYLHLPVGTERHTEALLFSMREGRAYGESTLARDFRTVSDAINKADRRQLRDMRRSGIMEAFTGDADGRKVAEKFGNSIDRSNRLFKTYNPVDLAKVREADKARVEGRRRRRQEGGT